MLLYFIVDKTSLLACTRDDGINIIDLRTNQIRSTLLCVDYHPIRQNKTRFLQVLNCFSDVNMLKVQLGLRSIRAVARRSGVFDFRADGFRVATDWTRAVFSPDGEYVIAGSADGSVFVWEVATSKLHSVLRQHRYGFGTDVCIDRYIILLEIGMAFIVHVSIKHVCIIHVSICNRWWYIGINNN